MLASTPTVRRCRGFTIIEAMVTIAIAAVVLALGAPAFGLWMQNSQVRTVTESIQNGLQVARNEALRRNCRVEFSMNSDTSWKVTAKNCGAPGDVLVQERVKNEAASGNITAAADPVGATTATFDGFGRVVDATPFIGVDVQSAMSGTKKLRIQVKGGGGQIRLCDPDVSTAADPRYCQ
jgi:type IV fimbrial biogenesis protein FimT